MSASKEFEEIERHNLIEGIKKVVTINKIDPTSYAFLWLSDLDRLRNFYHQTCVPTPFAAKIILEAGQLRETICEWLAKTRKRKAEEMDSDDEDSTEQTAQPTKRSKGAIKSCLDRESAKCCITKAGEPIEAAHIFPAALRARGINIESSFWAVLRMFWSGEKVKRWADAVKSTETTAHLLCMCRHAHGLWSMARFALRPIESTSTTLTAEFCWLPAGSAARTEIDKKLSIDGNLDHSPNNCKLFDCLTGKIIRSGHVIEFKTTNAEEMPVPSADILEMQWHLNRIAAISAAADVSDDDEFWDGDDDDDKGIPAVSEENDETPVIVDTPCIPWTRGRAATPQNLTNQENVPLVMRPNFRSTSTSKSREQSPATPAGRGSRVLE